MEPGTKFVSVLFQPVISIAPECLPLGQETTLGRISPRLAHRRPQNDGKRKGELVNATVAEHLPRLTILIIGTDATFCHGRVPGSWLP